MKYVVGDWILTRVIGCCLLMVALGVMGGVVYLISTLWGWIA